jgi:hypothetical protein
MPSRSEWLRKAQTRLIGKLGVMLGEVILDVFKVVRGGWRPSGLASRLEHSLDARIHFFFFDEFAAISLLEAFADASSKLRVAFEQA